MLCVPVQRKRAMVEMCTRHITTSRDVTWTGRCCRDTGRKREKLVAVPLASILFSVPLFHLSKSSLHAPDLQTFAKLGAKITYMEIAEFQFQLQMLWCLWKLHSCEIGKTWFPVPLPNPDASCHILTTNPQGNACQPAAHLAFSSSNTVQTQQIVVESPGKVVSGVCHRT